jgi:hypothetical protein
MKKLMVIAAAALMLLSANMAFADDFFKVTLGLKAWNNSWQEDVTNYNGSPDETYDFGSALMVGPSLNMKFGKGFAGVTYTQSTSDYESDALGTAKRTDVDVTLGVKFIPYFGAFIGYKTLDADLSDSITGQQWATWKLKGPGIGLLANAPLGSRVALYGNVAYMKLSQEFSYADGSSNPNMQYDLDGFSGEIGVAVAFADFLSANLGYKAQSFSGTFQDDSGEVQYTFKGLTAGVNFTF